ncbi:MAG: LacI family DNA-binding transcriptional regulator [Azospirillaceae bacterium]|nr:LacI family DNA-binding transcriptional regulator [Azospirillaceae bacterium]
MDAEDLADLIDVPEPIAARVTIRDVAREAGVSISTASKALNDQGRMTPETRDRIRTVAQTLGFTPNAMARALVSQRSFTIGLLTNDTYGRFTLPVAAGLAGAMVDRGVSVFLCALEDDPERARINLRAMQEKCVDGLIVAGKRIDRRPPLDLARLPMPVVHVNSAAAESDIAFVPDDFGGAKAAVAHLIALGRRRIAHVTGPDSFAAVALRAEGWRDALGEADLPCFGVAERGDWSEAFGFAVGCRLIMAPSADRPDAVFCGNDQIARGLIDALTLHGIRVPDDLAVVGYDNWEIFAAATRPPLTSVDMALTELGRIAGAALLDLVGGTRVEPGIRRMPCRLVVRQSCGAPAN